jgi:hypothetical protein
MKFDVKGMIESIKRNVVPVLPEELQADTLEQRFSDSMLQLILAKDDDAKILLAGTLGEDFFEAKDALWEFVVYLKDVNLRQLDHDKAVEVTILGRSAERATALCSMFYETLRKFKDEMVRRYPDRDL